MGMAVQEPIFTSMQKIIAVVTISEPQAATELYRKIEDFAHNMKLAAGEFAIDQEIGWDGRYVFSLEAKWEHGLYAFDAVQAFKEVLLSLYGSNLVPPNLHTEQQSPLEVYAGAGAKGPSSLWQPTIDWAVTSVGQNLHGDINDYSSLLLEFSVDLDDASNRTARQGFIAEWEPLTRLDRQDLQQANVHMRPAIEYLASQGFYPVDTGETKTYSYNRRICTPLWPFFLLEKVITQFTEAEIRTLAEGLTPLLPKVTVTAIPPVDIYLRRGDVMVYTDRSLFLPKPAVVQR